MSNAIEPSERVAREDLRNNEDESGGERLVGSGLGKPGTHVVGTGLGAVGGGLVAGAAVGTVAGPIGTVVGAVAGAVVGGLAGTAIAEMIDPTAEDDYWRENYSARPYVRDGAEYGEYAPAYRYGVAKFTEFDGSSFEDSEPHLMRDWEAARGESTLAWDEAREATRDSWERLGARYRNPDRDHG